MRSHPPHRRSLSVPMDAGVLAGLGVLQTIALAVALLLAGLTFLNWIVAPVGDLMPQFFRLMRANNAFLGIVCGIALLLQQPHRSLRSIRAAHQIGLFVLCFAALLLASDLGWIGLGINTLFAADHTHPFPGRVSPQAASTYMLLGLVLATLRVRVQPFGLLADLAAFALCSTMSFFLASYILGLSNLFTISSKNPFALQTYILLTILTAIAVTRRAEFGLFAVLLSRGVGGQFARVAAPLAFLLPFAFALGDASLRDAGSLHGNVLTAQITSLVSLAAFCGVALLGAWTDRAESRMEQAILRDDLTHLHNRRGFLQRAANALRLTQREFAPFFLLLLDLDGLRRINQTLGHATGSVCLSTIAGLLSEACTQTDTELTVLGRIGGDEFALAAQGDAVRCAHLVHHLEAASHQIQTASGEPLTIPYSVGAATSCKNRRTTLHELLERAEWSLTDAKRLRAAQATP